LVIQTASFLRLDALSLRLRRPRAIVVVMHETPASLKEQFRQQLEWAAHHFTITTLERFATLWNQSENLGQSAKPLLLFTFDDGRESNYSVAAPLLESFGGRGVFFIVPAFAECADQAQALDFYRTRINPNSKRTQENDEEDKETEDWKPMTPAQVADLASRGHAIGNHSLSHERLVGLSPQVLQTQIVQSAQKLSAWTRKPIDAFAWTFGSNEIDANAWNAIVRSHRFCFSPCAGVVDQSRDRPSLLWRREIEVRYSPAEFKFAYSGLVDLWWTTRRKHLRQTLRASSE
jgi:peptidoglycan/xylan/chitin deacetylase (PgdA/CDA1 family)